MGYPAFVLDSPRSTNEIYEEIVSAVGHRGFQSIVSGDRYDIASYKAEALEHAAVLRPCTIIPRGHPARI